MRQLRTLRTATESAQDSGPGRNDYLLTLLRRQKYADALKQVNLLLENNAGSPRYLTLKGVILVRMGDHTSALDTLEAVLRSHPRNALAQLHYGHTLKSVGRFKEAVAAYRCAIKSEPTNGEAYWSLANLKTFRFTQVDIVSLRTAITSDAGKADNQSHLAFAMGKALEDLQLFDQSFQYYRRGNKLRGKEHHYDPLKNRSNAQRTIKICTEGFFAKHGGGGYPARDPIFIVGLPRAGSTLLEQILASHSMVEGTAELPDIIAISRKIGGRKRDNSATLYPEILTELSPGKLHELGESYLTSTRPQRRGKPFFIDKMPNNFPHIGLIHLILPNAKIIDARRHPMAGCFSAYKQLFAQGQAFTYKLSDLGHYYRDYVNIMDHWDAVLPGRVLRVQYEEMVADPEVQIRRLLSHCGLSFEPQCLKFYETERAVRTPSSEQVRQPIYTGGLEHWRHFETHLYPLKKTLGLC